MKKSDTISEMLMFLFEKIRKKKYILILSFLALLGISYFEFKIPQITQTIIDQSIPEKSFQLILINVTNLMVFALFLSILSYFSTMLMSKLSQEVIIDVRGDLYTQILKQDMSYFENAKTGDLMTRLSSDVKTIQDLISPQSLKLISNIFTFFFILFFMFKQDSKLTLLIMITFPMLYLLNVFFSKRIKLAYKKVRNSTSLVNNHLQTSLTSILLIKTFTSENSEEEKFKELNNQNKNDYLEAMKYQTVFSPAIDLVNYLGLGIVLLYSGSQIIKGEQTIGSLVAYMAYLKMLQNPIRSFTQMVSRFQQAVVSYSRIIEIFDSEPKITTVKDSMQLEKFSNRIVFKNVTFSYKNNINVLNKVNFDMKYGEVTAIVGISGSRKSTITKLIERLYDVTDGKILIDSHDIKKYSLESLRNNIGLVSQDIELIDGTIYENIIYGQPNKSDKEVIKAIEAANLVEFINNLPKGVETEVGEKGIKLSGGQKQRIAIARIFLKNAPVLILDEATASLDNESERYIQESLDQLLEKRTSIVIAHRLSTIQKADQILVLDQGMIVEKGTHEELLNKNKRYRKLYDAQFS